MSKAEKKQLNDCWNQIGVWSSTDSKCSILEKVVHCHNCVVYSNAGRELLDREPNEQYLNEWKQVYSAPKSENKKPDLSILAFRLGDEWFGLATDILHEITDITPIHSIPHRTSPVLKGLVNIRGKLTLCVSLGRLLNIERVDVEQKYGQIAIPRLIIVRNENDQYAFLASEIHAILPVNNEQVKAAPATVNKSSNNFVTGVVTLDNKKIGILGSSILFQAINRNIL